MNSLDKIADMIKEIKENIIKNGGNIYLVGGSVRDIIMQEMELIPTEVNPKDFDFCITGFSQEQFEEIFSKAIIQGKEFPVYIFKELKGCEFALARKERKAAEGYRGFKIITSPEVTIKDDLIRRDVTVNSISYDFSAKKIIDPFGGVRDIKTKLLRATSEAFKEDPLRVYRVAQLAARLSFEVEPETIRMMNGLKAELSTISAERVFVEMRKAFKTKQPSRFFMVLSLAGVLDVHFPEIARLIGVPQPEQYHPEGDAFNHSMIVLDKAAEKTDKEEVIYAALVHDVGKGATDPSMWPRHIGHDKAGIPLVADMVKRLKLPNSWENAGKLSASEHMRAGIFEQMKPDTKVSFLEKAARSRLGLKGLEIIAQADGSDVKFAELGEKMLKAINGRTLKVQEGKDAVQKIHQERIKWIREQNIDIT